MKKKIDMNKNLEYYINKNKHTCIQLPKTLDTCLDRANHLSEFVTDAEKELARQNLGIDEIIGDLQSQLNELDGQIENISLLDNCNIYNAKKEGTLQTIVVEVPLEERALGKLVTFKENGKWVIYQYVGDNINEWGNYVNLCRNWKKIDISTNFGINFKSSDYLVPASNDGSSTSSKIILKFTSFGNMAYDIKFYDSVGHLIHSENTSNSYQLLYTMGTEDRTFTVTAHVNGELYTKSINVYVTYPMWVGMDDARYEKRNDVWQFIQQSTKIRKKLSAQEFTVHNITCPEYPNATNPDKDSNYLYIAIPKKTVDLFKVSASLNGFDIPLEMVDNKVQSNSLLKTYKVYKSKERFILGKYDIKIKIHQLEVSDIQSIEEFNPDIYDDIIVDQSTVINKDDIEKIINEVVERI